MPAAEALNVVEAAEVAAAGVDQQEEEVAEDEDEAVEEVGRKAKAKHGTLCANLESNPRIGVRRQDGRRKEIVCTMPLWHRPMEVELVCTVVLRKLQM